MILCDKFVTLSFQLTYFSGSTALVALINKDTLTVANVGDSRGVLCDKDNSVIPLSYDHKPQHVGTLLCITKTCGKSR